MKNKKNKNLRKLQNDIRSSFGISKSGGGSKFKKSKKGGVTKSRKERRKEARSEQKQRRLAFYAKKHNVPITTLKPAGHDEKPAKVKKKKKPPKPAQGEKRKVEDLPSPPDKRQKMDSESSPPKKKNWEKAEDAVRAQEERMLRQLEKQLKMKKKKTLPKAFIDDGLDYLLDVVDKDKVGMLGPDSDIDEGSSSSEEDVTGDESMEESGDESIEKAVVTEKKGKQKPGKDTPLQSLLKVKSKKKEKQTEKKKVHFADDTKDSESDVSDHEVGSESDEAVDEDDEPVTSEEEPDEEGDEDEFDDEGDDNDDEENADVETEGQKEDGGVREDIYGRLVDAEGNVIPTGRKSGVSTGGAYIPPAKRAAMMQESSQNAVERERLKKQMKGLLNRASESNMQSIASAIEELYMNHSRAAVNDTLFALIMEACVSEVMTPDRFVAEMAMLISILHGNVGSEIGSYFLEHLVKKFDAQCQMESYGEGHTVDNLLQLMAYLYNFKVAHHTLLFDIMTRLVDRFGEKEIELILLLLKAAGFSLRKDDPAALGQQISAVQKKAQTLETDSASRVHYMLEVLLAVRNNNMRKVPGADTERIDRLRRLAGSFIRGSGLSDNQLNVGLKDFLQAEEAGRWWLVGSAWDGRTADDISNKVPSSSVASKVSSVVGSVSQKLMDVARKLHMNSDVRRSIFFVLMSSEDYLDAFQKVLQLGIKGQQEREMVVVAVECCKREATYNPYYSYFLARLAGHDRRFMMALQFHMWDIFKTLSEVPANGRHNLALLLAHLLSSQALPLSALKVLEFGALDKATERFLRTTLAHLLASTPTSDIEAMFRRIAQHVKLQLLAEGLRVFLASSLKLKKIDDVDKETLKKHLTVASTELAASVRTVL